MFRIHFGVSSKSIALKQATDHLNNDIMNDQTEKSAIEKLLLSYGEALNASSVNLVLSLYTEDIVFMPYNASPANGKEELKAAYESAFKTVRLDVEFHIVVYFTKGQRAMENRQVYVC